MTTESPLNRACSSTFDAGPQLRGRWPVLAWIDLAATGKATAHAPPDQYVLRRRGMATEVNVHTPHWRGYTLTVDGMRTDVANLLPAGMLVADMIPDAVGTWSFHCHVGDYKAAGMQARYKVNAS
jgi:hypothetical protein